METLGPKNTREQKGRGRHTISMSKVKERISELENTFFKHTQVSRNLEEELNRLQKLSKNRMTPFKNVL